MRNALSSSILFLGLATPVQFSAADPVLWYRHPAQKWGDALPIGNGRLGAMVYGGIAKVQTGGHAISISEANGDWRVRLEPHKVYTITFE